MFHAAPAPSLDMFSRAISVKWEGANTYAMGRGRMETKLWSTVELRVTNEELPDMKYEKRESN